MVFKICLEGCDGKEVIMKQNPCFVLRFIHHLYLLIPVKRNSITKDAILLNKTAAMIFQNCESAQSAIQLADILAEQFTDVPPAEVKMHLLPYIENMIKEGFLLINEDGKEHT